MNAELIARLEAAEVGSRELDLRMFERFDLVDGERWSDADLEYALTDPGRTINPPHYTTSIDAALAMAARVLPDVQFNMATGVMGGLPWVQCYLFPQEEDNYLDAEAAATLPLSLCIAILRALDAQEQK